MPTYQYEMQLTPDVQARAADGLAMVIAAGAIIRLSAVLPDAVTPLPVGEGPGVRDAAASDGDHTCPECGRQFKAPQGLAAHMRKHKPKPSAGAASPSTHSVPAVPAEAQKVHVATGNHVCGICSQGGFRTSADLNRHTAMAHRGSANKRVPPVPTLPGSHAGLSLDEEADDDAD